MIETQSHVSLEDRLLATLAERQRLGCAVAAHESSECLRKAMTDAVANLVREGQEGQTDVETEAGQR